MTREKPPPVRPSRFESTRQAADALGEHRPVWVRDFLGRWYPIARPEPRKTTEGEETQNDL